MSVEEGTVVNASICDTWIEVASECDRVKSPVL